MEPLESLAAAVEDRRLPLRVTVTGGRELANSTMPESLVRGPVKLVLADEALASPDAVASWIAEAHDAGRPVAIHCVTRVATAIAVAAWNAAGARSDDRVEHGSVIDPALGERLAALGVTVVTQPSFVYDRGDHYADEVDPDDLPYLYPCASLLGSGVRVGGSTDAPFGDPDPWQAIASASTRRAASGRLIGAHEAVAPRRALDLFLTRPAEPGGRARRVEIQAPADLVLLDRPLRAALMEPSSDLVVMTLVAGRPSYLHPSLRINEPAAPHRSGSSWS